MSEKTKIGTGEVSVIVLFYTGAKIFLGLPRVYIEIGATAGWLIPLLSGMFSLILWSVNNLLYDRFPGKNILAINTEVAGTIFGTFLNLMVLVYSVFTSGNLLREFCEAVLISALPETPISVIVLLFLVTVLLAVYIGFEPLVRCAYIVFPFIFFGTLMIILATLPLADPIHIFPLLGSGLKKILTYAAPFSSAFMEVVILAILMPYFSFDNKEVKKIGYKSIIMLTLFFSLTTLMYQIVLPYPSASESFLPLYQMARSISVGRFLQRVEALYILFWTFSAFIRLALALFLAVYLYKEVFRLPYMKPLIPAIAVIFFSAALTPANFIISIQTDFFRLILGGLVGFGIPFLVLILALVRGKGEKSGWSDKKG